MGTFLSPRQALIMASIVVLVTLFTTTADAKDPKECLEFHLPPGVDLRTWKAKTDPVKRPRLIDSPERTTFVVIGAVLIVLTNLLLCYLLFSDSGLWGQRTYRFLFNLAITDLITGILLGFAVLVEMESVQKSWHFSDGSPVLCKFVIAGLWLCVVTSIYIFTVISVARWLMLNHPLFYQRNFQNKPMWTSYIGIAACWLGGAIHAIPLLTSWNDECVTDFSTCSLPYKSPIWISSSALLVLGIPSLIIVVVYSLILLNMKNRRSEPSAIEKAVTTTLSILTAAFLLCWWPLGIYLSYQWNTSGGSRGFYAGAVSSLVNPLLLLFLNNQLKEKVSNMFNCRTRSWSIPSWNSS